jgi:hypothetical protein
MHQPDYELQKSEASNWMSSRINPEPWFCSSTGRKRKNRYLPTIFFYFNYNKLLYGLSGLLILTDQYGLLSLPHIFFYISYIGFS